MKIAPIISTNKNFYQKEINKRINYTTIPKDTVSFRAYNNQADQNIQLYRSISESEFKKLISGEKIICSGYATSSPKGWNGNDWQSGYVFDHSEPVYFVTFKTGVLSIQDRRDSDEDTRYGFGSSYNLSHVDNIRKGANAHGEMVYAENLQQAKAQDVILKKQRINFLKTEIQNTDNDNIRVILWDELASYAKEFPQLISDIESIISYSLQADVNGLAELINAADNPDDLEIYIKCANAYIKNNLVPTYNALGYLCRNAKKENIPLIIKLLDHNKSTGRHTSLMLDKCTDEDNFNEVALQLKKLSPRHLLALSVLAKNRNAQGKYTQVFRDVLSKAAEIENFTYELPNAVEICANELAKYGGINDIPLLMKFSNINDSRFYSKYEVRDAIKKIKHRFA